MAKKKSRSGNVNEFADGKLWFHLEGNILVLGITTDAVDELDEIESIELPEVGDDFDKEDVVCEVHGSNGKIKVITPAAGFVTEVSGLASEDTQIVSEDPIDEGWLVKIEMQDESDIKEYL